MIDFWESRDAFDRFIEGRMKPTTQELGERGFPSSPDVKEFRAHNLSHVVVASA